MAEEKKRGRPKKETDPSVVENESRKMIQMSEGSTQEKITMDAVSNRWANIFGRYASTGFDNIASAWTQAWSQLNNPFLQNYRIKQVNAKPLKAQQEELQKALSDPESYEDTFKRISMWLYYTNYVYNILIKLNRDTPLFNYFYLPQYVDEKDMESDLFKRESKKVDKILKAFKPSLTLRTITAQVSLEGKSSYLPRTSYTKDEVNFFVMQKLNSDMVKLTGFGSKQQFIASFNMMIFLQPAYDVSQYPKFIQDTWEEMVNTGIVVRDKRNKIKLNPKAKIPTSHTIEWTGQNYMYWVQLPQDLCYTFYSDGAHPNAFPDTIGLFNDLSELDDYKWLQANLLSKGVNSILTAEVPLIKDPKAGSDSTVITPDTILGYEDFFSSNISGNILPFFAPFKEFELHTLENQPESMNIIYDRTRDLIATSGNSALMSITDKPSIASVKASQMIQAARVDYLTRQYESFLNDMINTNFELKFKWKVSIWGDIFNVREDIKILKEQVVSGLHGMLPKLLSASAMTLEDYISSQHYIKALRVNLDKIIGVPEVNPVGRPKIAEDEIVNDNTGTSSDMGNNVSDIKEFSVRVCQHCGAELSEDENYLCDECLEATYEERLLNTYQGDNNDEK